MPGIFFSRVLIALIVFMISSMAFTQVIIPPHLTPRPHVVNGLPVFHENGVTHAHTTLVQSKGVELPFHNHRDASNVNIPFYYNAGPSPVSVSKVLVVCVMVVGYFFAL